MSIESFSKLIWLSLISRFLKVKAFEDDCLYFKNKDYEVDLFYGKKEIVLVVRAKSSAKKKLIKNVEKYSVWKKFPKRKVEIWK